MTGKVPFVTWTNKPYRWLQNKLVLLQDSKDMKKYAEVSDYEEFYNSCKMMGEWREENHKLSKQPEIWTNNRSLTETNEAGFVYLDVAFKACGS